MARKIRKRPPSPMALFIKLLIPWIVMAAIAVAAFSAGYSDLVAYSAALSGALAVTFIIHLLDRKRNTRRSSGQ